MKRMMRFFSAGVLAAVLAAGADKAQDAERMLKAAMNTELVDGNLKAAIEQYKKVAQSGVRSLAAQALVHIADCYQKMGDAQARGVYERVVRDYADQKEAVATARVRLGVAAASGTDPLNKRLVCRDCGDSELNTDGRWIAFTDWDNGDLAVRDLSTGQVKRLMAKPGSWKDSDAYAESPVLSPDLRQVAYLWDMGEKDHRHVQVRIMANEPGAKPRILVDNPEYSYVQPAAWTADGKSILAAAHKRDRTWELEWISAGSGAEKPLKSLQWRLQGVSSIPQISPDGRFIAYAALAVNPSKVPSAPSDPTDQHIYILAADGSSETEVVKTAGFNKAPLWTPDGKHILFTSDRSGNNGLWSIAVENGKPAGPPSLINLNLGSGKLWPNTVARSGSYYYSQMSARVEQISVASLSDGNKSGEPFVGVNPAWSPDGKWIAFKRHHPGSETAYDLVVHSVATGDEKILATTLGYTGEGKPVWFHDSKGIVTGLQRGSTPSPFRIDLETGEWKPTALVQAPMALSPDDKTQYVLRDNGIIAVDVSTGKQREVLSTGQIRPPLSLSPAGSTLAFWRNDAVTRETYLSTVGVDGANVRDLYSLELNGDTRTGDMAWTRDGQAILFFEQHGEKGQIMRISAQGGRPEFTGIQIKGRIGLFGLSPDGSRIVYSSGKVQEADIWALDNILAAVK